VKIRKIEARRQTPYQVSNQHLQARRWRGQIYFAIILIAIASTVIYYTVMQQFVVRALGELDAKRVNIEAPATATITYLPPEETLQVTKGMLIVKLDDRVLSSRLEEAKARLAQAKDELERVKSLHAAGLVGEAAVRDAENSLHIAKTQLRTAESQLLRMQIFSPIDGIISRRFKEVGETAVAGEAILQILDPEDIWIICYIPERISSRVQPGQRAIITFNRLPEKKFKGHVAEVQMHMRNMPTSQRGKYRPPVATLPVIIRLDDIKSLSSELFLGMSARVMILLKETGLPWWLKKYIEGGEKQNGGKDPLDER